MSSSGGTPYALPGQVITGTGSPLGAVTPSGPGVIYQDTTRTNGAASWVSTGTTSGAWKVMYGDTGWLDVSGWLETGWVMGTNYPAARVRRIGIDVHYQFRVCTKTSGLTAVFVSTAGFRPSIDTLMDAEPIRYDSSSYDYAGPLPNMDLGSYIGSTSLRCSPTTTAETIEWNDILPTDDPWPTGTLP